MEVMERLDVVEKESKKESKILNNKISDLKKENQLLKEENQLLRDDNARLKVLSTITAPTLPFHLPPIKKEVDQPMPFTAMRRLDAKLVVRKDTKVQHSAKHKSRKRLLLKCVNM